MNLQKKKKQLSGIKINTTNLGASLLTFVVPHRAVKVSAGMTVVRAVAIEPNQPQQESPQGTEDSASQGSTWALSSYSPASWISGTGQTWREGTVSQPGWAWNELCFCLSYSGRALLLSFRPKHWRWPFIHKLFPRKRKGKFSVVLGCRDIWWVFMGKPQKEDTDAREYQGYLWCPYSHAGFKALRITEPRLMFWL